MGPSGLEDREAETQSGEPVKERYRGQSSQLYASETSTASRAGERARRRESARARAHTHTHLRAERVYGNEALLESH